MEDILNDDRGLIQAPLLLVFGGVVPAEKCYPVKPRQGSLDCNKLIDGGQNCAAQGSYRIGVWASSPKKKVNTNDQTSNIEES